MENSSSESEPKTARAGPTAARADLIQREIPRLALLIVVAIAAFFLTRAVAVSNREMNRRDAAEWYTRGQQEIEAGKPAQAVESFRRATIKDRNNNTYVPALARALALSGRDAEAARALLALRVTQPDNSEINLQLARLAAARHDAPEALRYYHYTLYSPASSDNDEVRRIRRELIEFLLDEHQNSRALSELFVLAADPSPTTTFHTEIARLFTRAGDRRHALTQYQEALRLDRQSVDALAGAAESAFELRDYPLARQYLHRVPREVAEVQELRTVVDSVLSSDPLAARIGAAERRRRLVAVTRYTEQRLIGCSALSADGSSPAKQAILQEWEAFRPTLRSPLVHDSDTLEAVVDLVERAERAVIERCPPATPMDRALLLIAELHRGPEQT